MFKIGQVFCMHYHYVYVFYGLGRQNKFAGPNVVTVALYNNLLMR